MMTAKILIVVFFLCSELQDTASADEGFKFSRKDKIRSISNGNETNFRNVSTACQLNIDRSSLKKISKLIHHKKKNAIELNVWIESFNNTLNKTRTLPDIKWANEMGRTLISLISEAEAARSMMLSSYTITLTPGIDVVDIIVSEKTKGCLLFSGKNASDIVFNFLLHQLYPHDHGDDSDYQLCIKTTDHDISTYNCCTLLGQEKIPVCSDYSSMLVESFNNLSVGVLLVFFFLAFPLIVEYLSYAQKDCIQYKLSDSPMSLSSIFYIIFIEGHGPVKSLGRRLVVTVLILLTVLPEWNDDLAFYIFVCSWALFFPFLDVHNFNEELNYFEVDANPLILFASHGNPTKIIALPFNLKCLWNEVNRRPFFRRHFKLSLNSATSYHQSATRHRITEHTRLLTQRVELPQQPQNDPRQGITILLDKCKYCLSVTVLLILYLLIALPILCSLVFYALFLGRYAHKLLRGKRWTLPRICQEVIVALILGVITYMIVLLSFINCLNLAFYVITGLYLNGGFYSVYFVPISIILLYSWNNWKSSVETKYLELNTRIYKVCKESAKHPVQVTSINVESSNDSFQTFTSSALGERFVIKLDENGEPVIPKPLYDIVRERFLPYDEILVPYFEGVFFVVMFAYFIYIFMSLAQTSGVSSRIQIISTMAATSLPFLVDFIWKKNTDEQKAANSLALKSKLKHVLSVCSSNNVTGEIGVEFNGTMPTDPFGRKAS